MSNETTSGSYALLRTVPFETFSVTYFKCNYVRKSTLTVHMSPSIVLASLDIITRRVLQICRQMANFEIALSKALFERHLFDLLNGVLTHFFLLTVCVEIYKVFDYVQYMYWHARSKAAGM